jgi:DNA-3-methyladenine glycosylase
MASRRLLTAEDFALPATTMAPRLIGAVIEAHGVTARITETEAYQGMEDRACHASRGVTARTEILFGECGVLYVYLCYGMHALLNLVCDREGVPAAVLLRAIDITRGQSLARARRSDATGSVAQLANGPAKLTQALGIGVRHHRLRLGEPGCPMRLRLGEPRDELACGTRIGVDYAGSCALRPWRWWEAGYPLAAKPTPITRAR